ncbi:putative Ig domain-containing protein, partial [Paraglaciecola sp.]|uniref:putative Ig domain-containing protein n=1 Tax=Paraglaciecola sp. TaxID=1920173 RepID=UPI0030F47DA3
MAKNMFAVKAIKAACMAGMIAGLLPLSFSTLATTSNTVLEQSRAEGIAWLLTHQNGDGSWGEGGAKMAATSEALTLLLRSSLAHSPHYARGLSWLANSKTDSTDYLARKIIVLEQAGLDTDDMGLIDELYTRQNTINSWGTYSGEHPSVIDSSLALSALYQHSGNLGSGYSTEVNGFFNAVVSAQKPNNFGWPHMGGAAGAGLTPQVMPTAIALQTMTRVLSAGWGVLSYTKRAVNWLVGKQVSNGRFIDSTVASPTGFITTATSYKALQGLVAANVGVTVASSVLTKAQDYLFAQQSTNGSWADDSYQTAIVLNTLGAITLPDTDGDGIPDDIESILGSNVNIADSVDYIQNNGIGSHFAVSTLMTQVIVNNQLNHTFAVTAANGAVTWKSTSLPAGLSFNQGVITGQPTQVGSYTFTVEVSDEYNNVALSSSRIEVIAANDLTIDTDNDGFLSSWEIANGFDPLDASDALVDSDNDGLPDAFEVFHGLDINDYSDVLTDSDTDGFNVWQEYRA